LDGVLTREEGEDAGFYEILQGTLTVESSNYLIEFVSGVTFEVKTRLGITSVGVSGLKVYPNPSLQGQPFYVVTETPNAIIQVFTLTGVLVTKQEAVTPVTKMSLSVPQGIYIISVGNERAKIEIR
jgi:hypothetical protein